MAARPREVTNKQVNAVDMVSTMAPSSRIAPASYVVSQTKDAAINAVPAILATESLSITTIFSPNNLSSESGLANAKGAIFHIVDRKSSRNETIDSVFIRHEVGVHCGITISPLACQYFSSKSHQFRADASVNLVTAPAAAPSFKNRNCTNVEKGQTAMTSSSESDDNYVPVNKKAKMQGSPNLCGCSLCHFSEKDATLREKVAERGRGRGRGRPPGRAGDYASKMQFDNCDEAMPEHHMKWRLHGGKLVCNYQNEDGDFNPTSVSSLSNSSNTNDNMPCHSYGLRSTKM